MTIENELSNTVGFSRKEEESEGNFKLRLVRAVDALSDDKWESLSPEAQEWHNTAVVALKSKNNIPSFTGEDEPETKDKPVSKVTKKKTAKKVRKKAGRKPQTPDSAIIRLCVDKNPKVVGTKAYKKFGYFKDGMTVGEYRACTSLMPNEKKEWANAELNYSIKKGYIKIEIK